MYSFLLSSLAVVDVDVFDFADNEWLAIVLLGDLELDLDCDCDRDGDLVLFFDCVTDSDLLFVSLESSRAPPECFFFKVMVAVTDRDFDADFDLLVLDNDVECDFDSSIIPA